MSALEFGKRLVYLRLARNIKQAEVALALRVSGAVISRWEHQTQFPGFWNILELCKFYNVSADWLLGVENEHSTSDELIRSAGTVPPRLSRSVSRRNVMRVNSND